MQSVFHLDGFHNHLYTISSLATYVALFLLCSVSYYFYLCQKELNIKYFCLYELLSHKNFPYDSNNRICNIFFRRKGNDDLLVLLRSYLHLHFMINTNTKEKVLQAMYIRKFYAYTATIIKVVKPKLTIFRCISKK